VSIKLNQGVLLHKFNSETKLGEANVRLVGWYRARGMEEENA
jgi:hypothetical protein